MKGMRKLSITATAMVAAAVMALAGCGSSSSSSRNIADSLKTVLFIGFLYACVMIYHSDYHLYTVSNI